MTVREVALEAIRLAEGRDAEDDGSERDRHGEGLSKSWSVTLKTLAAGPSPKSLDLHHFLMSLQPDVLAKLRTLMYVGRGDGNDVLSFHSDLGDGGDAEQMALSMAAKSPLAKYLRGGLKVADEASVDLDCPWPVAMPDDRPSDEADRRRPPRVFPKGQDPFADGPAIFRAIADSFSGDVVVDPDELARFFALLQAQTDGGVILDFIDMASWDQIEGYRFDSASSYLELYWHDYRHVDATKGRSEPSNLFLPPSLYGLLIRLREIRIVRVSEVTVFLLCGHALDRTEVNARLVPGSADHKAMPDRFFSHRFLRSVNNQVHVFDILTSPLYTTAILPKDPRLNTSFSRAVMFELNLQRVRTSVDSAVRALRRADPGDADTVCEKANTIRRNWEQALKIEIVLHDLRPANSYSKLLLGDLLKELRPIHTNGIGLPSGKVIGWANELSHDSGREVDQTKALAIAEHVSAYVLHLINQISLASK